MSDGSSTNTDQDTGASGRPDDAAGSPAIRITNLRKTFIRKGGKEPIVPVDNVSLDIAAGDLVVLLGPSGCGKTTLLRCVAGLERPDSGKIVINDRVVFSSEQGIFVPPEQRGINIIFQSYALWPHMSVAENVGFPLRMKKLPSAEIRERVERALDMVGLPDVGRSYPGQISGGQQQRVALARAIVGEDQVILFDEPLSNVDAIVRDKLRVELLDIKRRLGFSALYVTHDQAEAMELADKIAVLKDGKVLQYAPPREIYERPANAGVGNFIGTANMMPGTVRGPNAEDPALLDVETQAGVLIATPGETGTEETGKRILLLSRPEQWRIADPDDRNALQGEVTATLFSGAVTEYRVAVGAIQVRIVSSDPDLAKAGEVVRLSVAPRHLTTLNEEGA